MLPTIWAFSFLVGLPLILGAGLFKFFELFKMGGLSDGWEMLLVGFIMALVSGLGAIKLLLWLAERASFRILVVYRIILGIGLLLLI